MLVVLIGVLGVALWRVVAALLAAVRALQEEAISGGVSGDSGANCPSGPPFSDL